MKKIFITDIDSILGQALVDLLSINAGFDVYGFGFKNKQIKNVYKIDRNNIKELKSVLYEINPDYIVNSYLDFDIDKAKTDKNSVMDKNVKFTENICRIASVIESKIVAFSDYNVFNNAKNIYDEKAKQDPLNYLGKTFHMLENALKISNVPYSLFRLGFLAGFDNLNVNTDYYNTNLKEFLDGNQLKVPAGMVQPVFTNDVALAVEIVIENEIFDIFNFAGDSKLTYKELFEEVADLYRINKYTIKEYENKNYLKNAELLNLKAKTFFNMNFTNYNDIINFIKFQNN